MSETASAGPASVQGTRQLFDPAIAAFVDANVVLRHDMDVGATAAGPAIITEDETTLIVPSSRSALRQPDGCLDMRKTTRVKG